jgi:hypothetical protein
MNRDDNRQPSIVARYEAAKAAAHDLGFQLSVTQKAPRLFALEENGNTILTFADVANVDAFLHGVQNARHRRESGRRQRRRDVAAAKPRTSRGR